MDMTSVKRPPLTAADWTEASLRALAQGGLAAVAVEPLAARLGTTKGSFYWHFAGRDALIAATLELWEQRDTEGVIAAAPPQKDPADRLRALIRLVFGSVRERAGPGASVELALLATAGHPLVAPVLERVTERRLRFLTRLFADLGLSRAQARERALLAYSAYLGHLQIMRATPSLLPSGRAFTNHLDRLADELAPRRVGAAVEV